MPEPDVIVLLVFAIVCAGLAIVTFWLQMKVAAVVLAVVTLVLISFAYWSGDTITPENDLDAYSTATTTVQSSTP